MEEIVQVEEVGNEYGLVISRPLINKSCAVL